MGLANWTLGNGVLVPGGRPYFAVCPTSYVADSIDVYNPCVPALKTRMDWRSSLGIYVPPAGELILQTPATLPVRSVTPGVTDLTAIWSSEVIPDALLPVGAQYDISAVIGAGNPTAGVSGCLLAVGVSGGVPTGLYTYLYPIAQSVTPGTGVFNGITENTIRAFYRYSADATGFRCSSGSGNTGLNSNATGSFVAGNNKAYAMAKCSSTTDVIRLDNIKITSRGVL